MKRNTCLNSLSLDILYSKKRTYMFRYKMNTYDILQEISESFNYLSIDDINAIYQFIKKNETTVKKIVYNQERNTLELDDQ